MLEDIKKYSSLIVIGNGFDLHCGLKSKFSDYFESVCFIELSELYDCFESTACERAADIVINNEQIINFWSWLFYIQYYTQDDKYKISPGDSTTNWFDIEKMIGMSLKRSFDNGDTLEFYISKAFEYIKRGTSIRTTGPGYEIRYNPYIFLPFLQSKIYENPTHYLLNELHKFENSFKEYIFNQQLDEGYKAESSAFLNKLLKDNTNEISILNFNYTVIDDNKSIESQINIHGDIKESEIILGIDSNEIEGKEEYSCFTKTYRDLHKVKEIIQLPDRVDRIYFYGHSLADADFSYFYSLFDMYDLYDGALLLIFLYSDYSNNDSDNESNHNAYINRIYELINKYSKIAKGDNNLLHRLLLEGRILVKKI